MAEKKEKLTYCSLHSHTSFSFLDACSQIDKLAKKAKEINMPSLAISDHGNTHGLSIFYRTCKEHDVKPILGCEFYFTHDHEKKDKKSRHLTILCMNNEGLSNLYKLTTFANIPIGQHEHAGFFYRPRISWKQLEVLSKGLICLTGCINSPINHEFGFNEDYEVGKEHGLHLLKIFGKDRLFVELQNVNEEGTIYLPEQIKALEFDRKLAKDLGLKCVCTNDSHYLNKEDVFAHECLKAIYSRATLKDPIIDSSKGQKRGRMVFSGTDYYLRSDEEMRQKFTDE
jgi:DNA polymerase-3 subunit alpha